MQSIIIAYSREEDAKKIRSGLVHSGINTSRIVTSGAQVLDHIGSLDRGIIICGYKLRDMIFRDLAENLPEGFRLLLVASPARVGVDELPSNVVFLPTPVKIAEIAQAIEGMSAEVRQKKNRGRPPAHSEEERRIIETAKTLLMNRNRMSEPEAHRYLQKTAMDAGNTLIETAEMVLVLAGSY